VATNGSPWYKHKARDFPGSSVVKTLPSNAEGVGLICDWGGKIPHHLWPKNQSVNNAGNIVTNSMKTFKNGPYQKINLKKKRQSTGWVLVGLMTFDELQAYWRNIGAADSLNANLIA